MRLAPATSLALVLLSGCSVLVQPTEDRVRCIPGSVDPCPTGQRCVDGFCTSIPDGGPLCTDRELGCNGIDDNCNGMIDEGSDVDDDGFTWCSDDASTRDCRDDDAAIYPGASSDPPCDGADNDCSGTAAECVTGQFCHPGGGCRVPDCSFVNGICNSETQRCNVATQPPSCENLTPDNCASTAECASAVGTICDPVSRTCILPLEPGEPCTEDAQCEGFESGARCFETAALGLRASDVDDAAKVCSRPCCADADCREEGTVCWAPGTGARGCVPVAILAAGPSGLPVGAQPCGTADQCVPPDTCTIQQGPAYDRASRYFLGCGAPVGVREHGYYPCLANSDCESGLCLDNGCSAACARNSDCETDEYCGYFRPTGSTDDVIQACIWFFGNGTGSQGTACTTSLDCAGVGCIAGAAGNYCADTCCTDADCGSASYVCRPARRGERWGMLCQER